jgi:ABC-2 type transport system permease protein
MTAQLSTPPAGTRLPELKVTQGRVIRSEWTKFRSLRSTNITLLVAVVLTVGLGALISGVTAAHWAHADPGERAHFNATARSLAGVNISQLAVGVLGVLLITGEYATGMIRASLTVVPKRLPVLWAKLVVFVFVVLPLAIASAFAAFFAGQAFLSRHHIGATLSTPHAVRMIVGAGGYLVLVGLIGLALGAVLRNTAAGISALVALFFVIPPLMNLLPSSWSDHIAPYLPSNAGGAFWGNTDGVHLSALKGFLVLCIWAVVAIASAAARLATHDA